MTKLFKTEQVKKFFGILDKLSGSTPVNISNYPWKDYQTIYTKESKHCPTTREVFVHRTINKWLKGKFIIIYRTSNLGIVYKQYISYTSLSYQNSLNHSDYIKAGLVDYGNPFTINIFEGEEITYNDALDLEGEWCKNGSIHTKLLEFISMSDVPEKEYIFKAYDWAKYPKSIENAEECIKIIETTHSFIAKTEKQAYNAKNSYLKELMGSNSQLVIDNLIEVKLLEN